MGDIPRGHMHISWVHLAVARSRLYSDINLIGCLTDDELFNGASLVRARMPKKPTTLLEQNGIVVPKGMDSNEFFEKLADMWGRAVSDWKNGDLREDRMREIKVSRKLIY